MIPRLTLQSRDRRALWIAGFVIVPSLVLGRAIPAARALNERAREMVTATRREAHRAEAILAAHQRDRADSAQRRSPASWFVRAEGIAPATADLSDYIGGIARVSGVDIRSTVVRGDTAFVRGAARLEFRLAVTTDTEGMFTFLRELAVGPTLLPVRSIAIRQSDPAAPSSAAEQLTADVVLEAYVAKGTTSR